MRDSTLYHLTHGWPCEVGDTSYGKITRGRRSEDSILLSWNLASLIISEASGRHPDYVAVCLAGTPDAGGGGMLSGAELGLSPSKSEPGMSAFQETSGSGDTQ